MAGVQYAVSVKHSTIFCKRMQCVRCISLNMCEKGYCVTFVVLSQDKKDYLNEWIKTVSN